MSHTTCVSGVSGSLSRGVVTSMDRTDPISLGRLRLPRLAASGLQIGLQNSRSICSFQHPSAPFRRCRPWTRQRVRTRQATASGAASTRDASLPAVPRGSRWESLWEVPYGPEWEWLRREAQDFEETVAAGAVVPGVRGPPRGSGRAAGGCDGHRHGSGCLARHGAADPTTALACSYMTRTGTTSWRAAYVWSRGLSACPDPHRRSAVPA